MLCEKLVIYSSQTPASARSGYRTILSCGVYSRQITTSKQNQKSINNKPVELWNNKVIFEKINYIHNNPVEEGLVYNPEDYVYSSARDYSGEKGLLDEIIIVS